MLIKKQAAVVAIGASLAFVSGFALSSQAKADACSAALGRFNATVDSDAPLMDNLGKRSGLPDAVLSTKFDELIPSLTVQVCSKLLPLAMQYITIQRNEVRLWHEVQSICPSPYLVSKRANQTNPEVLLSGFNSVAAACEKVLSQAGASNSRKDQGEKCGFPPVPAAIRISPTEQCFTARNTNTEPRCVFSFTYILSGKGIQQGGNVAPNEKTERCSFQEGVDISFGKWALNPASAR